jgi:hypothetical protein
MSGPSGGPLAAQPADPIAGDPQEGDADRWSLPASLAAADRQDRRSRILSEGRFREPEEGDEHRWSSPSSLAAAAGLRVCLPRGSRPEPKSSAEPKLPEAMATRMSLLRRQQHLPEGELHKFDNDYARPAGFVSALAAPVVAGASRPSKGARKRARIAQQIRESREAAQANYNRPLPTAIRELRAADRFMSVDDIETERRAVSITLILNQAERLLDLAEDELATEGPPKQQGQEFEPTLQSAGCVIFRRSLQIGSVRRQSPDASV